VQKKKLEAIQPLTQQQWEKMHEGGSGGEQHGSISRWERD